MRGQLVRKKHYRGNWQWDNYFRRQILSIIARK